METFIYLSILLCLTGRWASARDSVPVVVWSNERFSEDVPDAANTFNNVFLPKLMGKKGINIVAFIQDSLNMEDFSLLGDVYNSDHNSDDGVFHNLKEIESNFGVTHLPEVTGTAQKLVDHGKTFKGKIHDLKQTSDFDQLELADDKDNLILIKLPATQLTTSQRKMSLKSIDTIIGQVWQKLMDAKKPAYAIYTGQHSYLVDSVPGVNAGRHLLAETVEADNFNFVNVSGCIFFYAQTITLQLTERNTKDHAVHLYNTSLLAASDFDATASNCSSGVFVTKYRDLPSALTKFQFTMTFTVDTDLSWTLTGLSVSYGTTLQSEDNVELKTGSVWAPQGFSYHCTEQYPFTAKSDNSSQYMVALDIKGLQVQYQNKGLLSQFGQSNDCEGFFSIPILSGLFTSLILISILTFGLSLISSINTPDRFDDPKGKPLHINVSE